MPPFLRRSQLCKICNARGCSCFSARRPEQILLRAVLPALSEGFARVHDTRVWECFSELLGVQAEGAPRNIAHLPFRHGGLGLAGAVLSRSAACWASWADCLPMVKATQSSQES